MHVPGHVLPCGCEYKGGRTFVIQVLVRGTLERALRSLRHPLCGAARSILRAAHDPRRLFDSSPGLGGMLVGTASISMCSSLKMFKRLRHKNFTHEHEQSA